MKNDNKQEFIGKIFYFEMSTEKNYSENYFLSPKIVNLHNNLIKELKLGNKYAISITKNNELIQWSKNEDSKKDNNYLSKIPTYIFNKIKFKSISINSTMCLALDYDSKVMSWGHNSNGLLGLGYDIKSIESPTYIEELKKINIIQIALSENHAVALSSAGIPYSWGLGKYGELGQEKTIYTPFPLLMSTENLYQKVFCNNFLTCFLDFEGHFSYFGVIIRNLENNDNKMNLTAKSLLEDENMKDGKNLIHEVTIEEIENEKVIKVVIGNGFVGLLCENGNLYVLEYKYKLTKLYSKYFCYDIEIYNNNIFGLSKDKNINSNYYLCQWSVNYTKYNLLSGYAWNSAFWIIKGDSNFISKYKLTNIGNSNEFINALFISDIDEKDNNDIINFEYDSKFDDSYNLRYKSVKSKNSTLINELSSNAANKSKSNSYKYLNKTYNNSIRLNYNHSLYKPSTQIKTNKFKNKNHLEIQRKINNNIVKENESEGNKSNNSNKENIDINIKEELIEYKNNELNDYLKEIDNVINNFKNRQNLEARSLIETKNKKMKLYSKNEENINPKESQKIFYKNKIQNWDKDNINNINMKNNNSKDHFNTKS